MPTRVLITRADAVEVLLDDVLIVLWHGEMQARHAMAIAHSGCGFDDMFLEGGTTMIGIAMEFQQAFREVNR